MIDRKAFTVYSGIFILLVVWNLLPDLLFDLQFPMSASQCLLSPHRH